MERSRGRCRDGHRWRDLCGEIAHPNQLCYFIRDCGRNACRCRTGLAVRDEPRSGNWRSEVRQQRLALISSRQRIARPAIYVNFYFGEVA